VKKIYEGKGANLCKSPEMKKAAFSFNEKSDDFL